MKRKKSDVDRVLRLIAESRGVSTDSVRKEIELALEVGRNSSNVSVQAEWSKIPSIGDIPTVDEVLLHLCKSIKKEM